MSCKANPFSCRLHDRLSFLIREKTLKFVGKMTGPSFRQRKHNPNLSSLHFSTESKKMSAAGCEVLTVRMCNA